MPSSVSGTTIMVLACLIVSIGQFSLGLVFPFCPVSARPWPRIRSGCSG
ncbi:hypothetical protein MBH78_09855 [Oceanimonas sp. NS1]|nr:hypothetical protein [Oceanimonas sp. NS1]